MAMSQLFIKCQNLTFKVNFLGKNQFRAHFLQNMLFDNFNFEATLFSKVMPNFCCLATILIQKMYYSYLQVSEISKKRFQVQIITAHVTFKSCYNPFKKQLKPAYELWRGTCGFFFLSFSRSQVFIQMTVLFCSKR